MTTDIDADRTLVTDQAGKQRLSRTNALGQLEDVWEVKASDANTEAITFGNPLVNLNGYKTSYSYDTLNNLTTVNQGSQMRIFTYSSLARLLSATNPELGTTPTNGTINYQYDNNGNLTQKTDPRGVQTAYIYDQRNRVTNRNYSTPSGTPPNYQATPDVTYFYDNLTNAKGKLIKVTNGTGADHSTTEYTSFDILGRVSASKQTTDGVTYGNGSTDSMMTYSYNLSGSLIEQQYPSGRVVKNVLDASGDLSIVESKKNAASGYWHYADSFSYNAASAVTSMQLGNGRWESTVFTSRLQPTQIALGTVQGGTDKLDLDFTYGTTGNNGNILTQTITVLTVGGSSGFTAVQMYSYDSLNRLEQAEEMPYGWSNCTSDPTKCWKQKFTFDRYGNRRFDEANTTMPASFSNPGVTNPTINAANKNQFDSGQGYNYDPSGNTTYDALLRKFTYDAENKQVKVESTNSSQQVTGPLGEYFYDGDGRRVKKYVPGTGETTVFVHDAAGKQIAEYSTVIAEGNDAKVAYLTNDHLGTPRINTNADGNVTARHDYHPFGEEISTTARASHSEYAPDSVRKQFTGYERDGETGLDYAKARTFGSTFGRFTSPDPLRASAKSTIPQSWNRYVYVLNNPLILTDPTGMVWGYYMDGNKRYFRWFDGKAGKHGGHTYAEWTGPKTLSFAGVGTVTLLDKGNRHIEPFARGNASTQGSGPSTNTVNHSMVKAIADHTEPVPRTLAVLAGAGIVGGVACAALCPAATGLTVLGLTETAAGVGAGVAANPNGIIQSVEGLAIRFGQNPNQIHHIFRHTDAVGLSRGDVQAAILQDIQGVAPNIGVGQTVWRFVQVGGETLKYGAHKLADGTISIGKVHGNN